MPNPCDATEWLLISEDSDVQSSAVVLGFLLQWLLLYSVRCYCGCICSMAEKLMKSQHLAHKLSQSNIDAMFPSTVSLLPPDIARQLGLESAQTSQATNVDQYVELCRIYILQHVRLKTFLFSLAFNWHWHYPPPAPLKLWPNGAIQIYYYCCCFCCCCFGCTSSVTLSVFGARGHKTKRK